jgi:acetyl esterase/lipase
VRLLLPLIVSLALVPATAAQAGVNTGLPGSTCVPTDDQLPFAPSTDPGITTGELGAAAPAYYELGAPTGAYAGRPPKGVMLVIHGGGWYRVGPPLVMTTRHFADDWRKRGWQTVNLSYGGCARSLDDVVTFHDLVREAFPDIPMCALGESAGGQLALMLAVRRPDLDCVVAHAAPTDLPGLRDTAPPTYEWAAAAFGTDQLEALSPVRHASEIGARVLLGAGAGDKLVPPGNAVAMESALADTYSDLKLMDGGPVKYIHTGVDQAALNDLALRELNLVAPLTGDALGECDLCGAGTGWTRTATSPTPAGLSLELTASNEVRAPLTNKRLADARATIAYTDTTGTISLKGASVPLPAGNWRLQTCYGATGSTFPSWTKCAERTVSTSAQSTQAAPTKSGGFARVASPYSFFFYVNVDRKVAGLWTPYGRSWRGNDGSRFIVPALGAPVG